MIRVTLLGTSALIPLPDRAQTAALLAAGSCSILFDCGEGTQTAARKAGVSLMKTNIIALTHYHGDHIFGIPGLLQTMNMMGRLEKLTIIGPAGLETEIAPILKLAGRLGYPVQLLEIPEEGILLEKICPGWPDGARMVPIPTNHRVLSQGYLFDLPRAGKFLPEKAKALGIPIDLWSLLQKGQTVFADGKTISPRAVLGPERKGLKVVFTGDTSPCDSLIAGAKEADLLLCEATYGENEQAQIALEHGHMNFAQAGAVAAKANVKRLWLMHYSQMIEDPEEYLENAKAVCPNAECGFDGKQITLTFPEESFS